MSCLLALVTAGMSTAAMAQFGTTNDSAARDIVRRIQTRTDSLQRAVQNAADRNNYRVEDIERMILDFESAANQLDRRLGTRRSASSADVQTLLDRGEQIDSFFANNRLGAGSRREWQAIRTDLDQLASYYNLRPRWSSGNIGNTGNIGGRYGRRRDLTGTFTLNQSRGDDVRRAVDNATRNLSLAERQRVYDSLLRRLDPPNMLAIDRRGNSVTIASTRAPQINFVADGREQVETTAGGRTVRVRANLVGDTLTITRTGERANDFTVSFDPTAGGNELLVTRTLYTDRLNQPVTVRTYYDRTSDVAQLNIYETNREDSNIGGPTTAGNFVIPDGTQLVAVLNNDLSTQNVREGDRFTMTVRSPGQYDGATLEGSVLNVERSGRVTGRSQMTFDFDTIRLRDGRSYRFAGILESVRTPNGDVVRVDNEGAVRDSDQTKQTVTRTAIGTAVGALIGAIAGGGKGAAIGAVVGAGAGAGSVYIQGRDDLNLTTGTEVTVRATGPRG
ncbi:MAG TPA: YMGG-like glycine zipper-containing protein [Pyrinomonadaceae bacterium]